MKYVDEYRDPQLVKRLAKRMAEVSRTPVRFMELCGTHTMAIARHGLHAMFPDTVEMISGPGCPVCVTATEEIDAAIKAAQTDGVMVATFGDLVRVPGSASSLGEQRAKGGRVEVIYSPLDAVKLAAENPEWQVVFLAIGFETTAPAVAATALAARAKGLTNFSLLSMHKLLPPAMDALLGGVDLGVSGFLCPGHVTTVIGTGYYQEVVRDFGIPCVVSGFEPADVMASILMLVKQVEANEPKVEIQYGRAVSASGNLQGQALIKQVFRAADAPWRGLGTIPLSGLVLADEFSEFDARARFDLAVEPVGDPPGCRCGEVLTGLIRPPECKLFATACDPVNPVGPCMVSAEGTCAAYYKYRRA